MYEGWGASHFAELWYVFDHLDHAPWHWSVADRKVAEEMSSYGVNFARSGDPNAQGLPLWPAVTCTGSNVIYLRDPIVIGGVASINSLKVFDAAYTTVRGTLFASTVTIVRKDPWSLHAELPNRGLSLLTGRSRCVFRRVMHPKVGS
ncbi:MAG: carboxylesterase family protein [Candidatus Sulfotelmatobacter sp.]